MSRTTPFESLIKKRPHSVFSIVFAGVLTCAGLLGTRTPALADSFSHLPTIDLYPTVSWATGNDEYGSPGGPDPANNPPLVSSSTGHDPSGGLRSGVLDLNAVISVPIVKSVTFQYEHDRAAGIDTTIGRVTGTYTIPGVPHQFDSHQYIYPSSSNDIVDTFRLNYSGIKGVGFTIGTFYRFRHNNAATNDPTNLTPADWHEQFASLSYTAPPIAALNGTTIGVAGTFEYNRHHVSAQGLINEEAAGFSDSDGKTRTGVNYGPNINIPISKGFALFGSASFGAFDFFDNAPVPFYYDIIDFGLSKKLNQVLAISADVNNLTQQNLGGWPFAAPNTIHRIYTDVNLDIHLAP